jgi:hypothetical protein
MLFELLQIEQRGITSCIPQCSRISKSDERMIWILDDDGAMIMAHDSKSPSRIKGCT